MNIKSSHMQDSANYYVTFESKTEAGKLVKIEHMLGKTEVSGLSIEQIYSKAWAAVQENFLYSYNQPADETGTPADPEKTVFEPPAPAANSLQIIGPQRIDTVFGKASSPAYKAAILDQYGNKMTGAVALSLEQAPATVEMVNDEIMVVGLTDPVIVKVVATSGNLRAELNVVVAEKVKSPDERFTDLETEDVNIMLALTQIYEEKEAEKAAAEKDSIDTMLALTEIYEMILGGGA